MQALGRLLRPSLARLLHDEISPFMRPQLSSPPSSSSPASSSSPTSSSSSSSPLLPLLKEKKDEKEEPSSTDDGSPLMDGDDDGGSSFVVQNATTNRHQRRRRVGNGVKVSFGPHLPGVPPLRQQSFTQEMGHAAAETYLITRLSFKLLRYLGVGSRWITKFLALGCYALLLMPGFLQVGYFYYLSRQVRRSIVYGDEARNRLDLYLPFNLDVRKPVVAFVTGGAWIIGYKAWGALLGQHLSERDVIVACLDYRNFPQGTISDMVKDVNQGISFVCNNIAAYGGDPNKIYVIGQSAGAHIAACALVDQAMKECGEAEHSAWTISQVKAYLGISGGYNLLSLVDHFHKRGLYKSIFLSIMEGQSSLERFSPEMIVQDPTNRSAISLLPPFFLFHGTTDFSIPSDASLEGHPCTSGISLSGNISIYMRD